MTGLPEGTWPWLQGFARWIGTWCFFVMYRLHIWHRERIPASGPVVVVSNHTAMVDGPLLFGLLGRRSSFLIKQEMFRGPFVWLLPRLGQLAVRRGTRDHTPLLSAVRLLRCGGVVVVFPEGTRGEGNVTNAHHGATWIARSSGALLLPVVVRGTRRPTGSGRRFRPRVDVLVGEPFTIVVGESRAELAAATEDMRTRLVALVAELDTIRGADQAAVRPEEA